MIVFLFRNTYKTTGVSDVHNKKISALERFLNVLKGNRQGKNWITFAFSFFILSTLLVRAIR